MSNLTRPSSPGDGRADLRPPGEEHLDELRSARRGAPPLPALSPAVYARGHAAFERRSNQRRLIAAHLVDRLRRRTLGADPDPDPGPVSVLSIGCGDGTLDAAVAAELLEEPSSRGVRYVGVDPYAASAEAFLAALEDLGHDRLSAAVHVADFADAPVEERFDVITFVHSVYYVRDVVATLRRAHDLLRPGGELLVLSAPRTGMNRLAEVLAPAVDGHPQWFSEDVATALAVSGLPVTHRRTLPARLDLQDAGDDVLDFTVQAELTPLLRTEVRAYLRAVADLGPGSTSPRVAHPVDVYQVDRPR